MRTKSTMFSFGLAAAVLTAIYAILLAETTLHSATLAAGCLFIGLAGTCCISSEPLTVHELWHGGKLFVVFALYQYFMKLALQQSTMNLAVVNLNLICLGVYEMYKLNNYSKLVELVSASVLFTLVSFFLATLFPSPSNDDSANIPDDEHTRVV